MTDEQAARAEDYIRVLVASAPPLTADQRARLAALFAPSTVDDLLAKNWPTAQNTADTADTADMNPGRSQP